MLTLTVRFSGSVFILAHMGTAGDCYCHASKMKEIDNSLLELEHFDYLYFLISCMHQYSRNNRSLLLLEKKKKEMHAVSIT